MINYSCDRCGCPLATPIRITANPMPNLQEIKKGIEMLLPIKTSVGYTFVLIHLCQCCLAELASWKNEKKVERAMVDDR